ncbi:MAG: leucine-rich repeat domain-containing protein [Parabacteroides sp.]|nr:leucine-rich repeat domain-containing protein [bacterium]MDY4101515.1 leucine-rich repeat domain-containing protein [Parabacteroides sp.]
MKQRLLYALLLLFGALGMANVGAQIVVQSNGTKDVVVTLNQAAAVSTSDDNVTLSTDRKKVTIKQGYTDAVTITATTDPTSVTLEGNLTSLSVTDNAMTSLSLNNVGYLGSLKVSSTSLTSLTCSGKQMTSLNILEASALTTLDASDNQLASLIIPSTPVLKDVNISKNAFTGLSGIELHSTLTKLDISDNQLTSFNPARLTQLTSLNVSGNQILDLDNPAPKNCQVTWGTQTVNMTTDNTTNANIGFRIPTLLNKANITAEANPSYSNVSWQVLDGTAYVDDSNKTAHKQSGSWENEYRFYDSQTKSYVKGTYQCTVTTGGRTYKIANLVVYSAVFNLKGESPANASSFKVSGIRGVSGSVEVSEHPQVCQGDKLTFVLEPASGYSDAEYTIKGMDPANSTQAKPYRGTSFETVVNGKYISQSESEEPSISALVLAQGHTVAYESPNQDGGSFTVQKVVGSTVSDLANGATIATGEKLVVKITPKTGYDFKLVINKVDKTKAATYDGTTYTYTEDITNTSYMDMDGTTPQSITITTTFTNASIKAFAKVDGKTALSGIDYLAFGKMILIDQNVAEKEISHGSTGVVIVPNTTYQLRFTLGKSASTDKIHRLKDITINGSAPISINKDEIAEGMRYSVAFKAESSDVTLSITTKEMQEAYITALVNNGGAGQKQVYDGEAKPVMFTTTPAGLEKEVEVTYITNATPSVNMGKTAPVNVGKYTAELKFIENDNYVPAAPAVTPSYVGGSVTGFELEIVKAPLKIETLPTVKVTNAGKYEVTGGKVSFKGNEITGTFAVVGGDTPATGNVGKSHPVEVEFTPKLATDQANFENPTATVNVIVANSTLDLYKISMIALPSGYSIQWLNGQKEVNISSDKFAAGTTLTAIVTYPKGTKGVSLEKTSALGTTTCTVASSEDGKLVYTVEIKEDTELKVVAGTGDRYTVTIKEQNIDYTGQPLAYDPASGLLIADKNGNNVAWSSITAKKTVSYKNAAGESVAEPIDAGTYTVCVTIAADAGEGYVETTATKAAFIVNKVKPLVYAWPKASAIAKGQTLSYSELAEGSVSIPGTFAWKNGAEIFTIAGTYRRPVIFTPAQAYQKNYIAVESRGGEALGNDGEESNEWVTFVVTDMQVVSFVQKTEGTIKVVNQLGNILSPGSPVSEGDILTITATPKEGYILKSLTVNGVAHSGAYTVGASSVAIEAIFEMKPSEPEVIVDPNTQYVVTLPAVNAVRGVKINKAGANAVKIDQPFSFTVSTLAADANKVVVRVGATVITPVNGLYTIDKVSENMTVSVTLSDPTPIQLDVEKETKNAKGYLMGTVQVLSANQLRATIPSYYYNDEVTLIAYPASGVTFAGWSDDRTILSNVRTLTLTQDVKIMPIFTGVPTSVEDIEAVEIMGGDDCIIVRGAADARITIVSMDGRAQQQTISGDVRINVNAGVYGVILEQGNHVRKEKIIVR